MDWLRRFMWWLRVERHLQNPANWDWGHACTVHPLWALNTTSGACAIRDCGPQDVTSVKRTQLRKARTHA